MSCYCGFEVDRYKKNIYIHRFIYLFIYLFNVFIHFIRLYTSIKYHNLTYPNICVEPKGDAKVDSPKTAKLGRQPGGSHGAPFHPLVMKHGVLENTPAIVQ